MPYNIKSLLPRNIFFLRAGLVGIDGSPLNSYKLHCGRDGRPRRSTHEYARVRTSTPEYARVRPSTHEYARVCTSTPEYARVRPSTPEYARVRTSTHEYARVRPSTHEYARVRTSTHEYARVRTSTHEYARVRTSTHEYARVRPSTPEYARVRRVRPSTPEYARVRPSTPDYARVRTSTHDYARVRTSLFQSMCIHCWKSIMRKSCLQNAGGGGLPNPALFLAAQACFNAYAYIFGNPSCEHRVCKWGGSPPPNPPVFFEPSKLASKHMPYAYIKMLQIHHARIVFANLGASPPPPPHPTSPLYSYILKTHHARIVFCKWEGGGLRSLPIPSFVKSRASCLQSIYIHAVRSCKSNKVNPIFVT